LQLVELRGYRFEPLVLALVAVAALSAVNLAGPQDRTRYELTRSLVLHGTLVVPHGLFDRAEFGGRSYSDKAPGMSFLAVPAFEVERLAGIDRTEGAWHTEGDLSLWLLRVLGSGLLFLVAVFTVGRVAEGLVPNTGALTAVAFGAGSLAASLAPTFFEHDAAGAFGILAFVLATRAAGRRGLMLAGLCAGVAVLFQYAAALIALAVAVYCARRGLRRLGWFLLGGVPAAAALAAYDAAAFGSPFHLSYRYVANRFTERQHRGFFGIGVPQLSGLKDVFVGNFGLLVTSPVVLAAAVGLVLLWRRGRRAEAAVAGAVTVLFVLLDAAYFLPYGGGSPGPRFLAPALPFLFLGLPLALQRFRVPTLVLLVVSVVATTANSVTWGVRPPEDTAWLPTRDELAKTIWTWLGIGRVAGIAIVLACALGAVAVAALPILGRSSPEARPA
jgi:phage shock protein PspC (stress-responsive transcriptional regulator)